MDAKPASSGLQSEQILAGLKESGKRTIGLVESDDVEDFESQSSSEIFVDIVKIAESLGIHESSFNPAPEMVNHGVSTSMISQHA